MGKVLKQKAGGYNIIVREKDSILTAFYSPHGHPFHIKIKRVADVEEALRYFYAYLWKKRKVFYCGVSFDNGFSCAVKLVPGKGNEHIVRVVLEDVIVDLYEVCILKEQMENFFVENVENILTQAGIKFVGNPTTQFNFQTKEERKQEKRDKKSTCITDKTAV